MSKQKLTPLMKFKETIKVNYDSFEDKGLYFFLLAVADKHIKKEKKVIAKAYDRGISDYVHFIENKENFEGVQPVLIVGVDYYESKYDLKSFNEKFIEEKELESFLKSSENDLDLIEKLSKTDSISDNLIKTENDIKLENFCKTLSETPLNINKDSDISSEQQVEELLIKRLQGVGIEPKSVQVIKL